MLVLRVAPSLRSNGCVGVRILIAYPMSFEAIVCNGPCLFVISRCIMRRHMFHDLWFAAIDSLEEMVHSCHIIIENECWARKHKGFDLVLWWVEFSVSWKFWILGCFLAHADI